MEEALPKEAKLASMESILQSTPKAGCRQVAIRPSSLLVEEEEDRARTGHKRRGTSRNNLQACWTS